MKNWKFVIRCVFMILCMCALALASSAANVYVDGTGATDGAHLKLADAVSAANDGDTIVISGDTSTPTGSITYLAAKDVTITSENNAKLILGRTIVFAGDTVFKNITIVNGAAADKDFIYASGHSLTFENSVAIEPSAKGRYFTLFAGGTAGSNVDGGSLKILGGTWQSLYAGCYSGTMTGNVDILIENATFIGVLSVGNLSASSISKATVTLTVNSGSLTTVGGTAGTYTVIIHGGEVEELKLDATIAPDINSSVTVGSAAGTITTSASDGYEVVVNEGVYTLSKLETAGNIVYLDASGKNGAYTTLPEAAEAVADGGTIIVSGDTKTPTTAYTFPEKDITITSVNGAVLSLGRILVAKGDLTFENITIANAASSNVDFIYANGNNLTIGEGVITTPHATNGRYISLAAGINDGTSSGNGAVTVMSGTWRNICGGNYQGTFSGSADIVIENCTLIGGSVLVGNLNKGTNTANVTVSVSGGNITAIKYGGAACASYDITLSGGNIASLSLDATVAPAFDRSVTVEANAGTITTVAPEGYEVVENSGVYTLAEKQPEVDMTPKTVYLDGTGKTEGAYTSLSKALSDMPGGGTIVISGDTEITSATTLPKTKEVTITSVYGDEDYRETAALKFYANLTLGGDTVFRDVVIERSKPTSANIFIIAAGNKLTMDTGVICLNYTTLQWITLVAGNYNSAYEGDAYITVKSGHFRNVFGGNYYGEFVGDTHVEITGGIFDNAVTGGNFNGNFTGDAYVNFGGEAALITSGGTPQGLVGGTLGENGKTAYTHSGNINIIIYGDSAPSYVFGASRNNNMTTKGNVEIVIKDRAYIAGAVYGGGYSGKLYGSTSITVNGGEVQGYVFGGGYTGEVTGDTSVTLNDGKLCYYVVAEHAAGSSPAGTRSAYAAGFYGKVGGNATFTMNGGSVYGNVYSGGLDTEATVGGIASAKFTGGTVFGAVRGENCTVDLSGGANFSVGVDSNLKSLIGGGTLTVAAGAEVTAENISGETKVNINGIPLPKVYLTALNKTEGAKITYIAQEEENLVENGNTYSIDFDGAYKTVEVTVEYNDGCTCELRAGGAKYLKGFLNDIASEIPITATNTSSTYVLAPGLYTALVKYPNSNWRYKAIYVYGNSQTQVVSVEFDAATTLGHEGKNANLHTDEIIEKYYDTSNIEGYFTLDTPYFNKREGSSVFTTNAEMMEHLYAKDASCDYMYLFDEVKTYNGYTVPVAVFTMDEIPKGATLAEIAEIVNETEGREILLFTGQVHGNEPCGGEGCLGMISEMCTSYGESVFDGTNIGAVIIIPRVNPEGSHNFTRETKYNSVNSNLNRDYMILGDVGTAAVVNAANLFMPTVYVDCHEAYHEPYWSESELIPDVYDIGLSFNTPIGGGLAPSKQSLYGDLGALNGYGEELVADITDRLDILGIRTSYYEKRSITSMADKFFPHTGVYGFIFEVPGIYGGPADIGRRSFVQMAGLKAVIALAIEEDGAIYAAVKAAQKNVAESAQIYDDRQPVVVHHAKAFVQKYDEMLYWNDPLVGADGTIRYDDNMVGQDNYNIAIKYRTRPTAYVFGAEGENLAKILQTLDRHDINYFVLPAGTSLNLGQYSGDANQAVVGEEKSVTFDIPMYIVPVDGYNANVIANLFEPENHDTAEGAATFVKAGYLEASDIYRSTESFIAAKLGLEGTYLEVAVPEGKTVESAVVDGEVYDSVNTEDNAAYVIASDEEFYIVELTFTDGTSETYHIGLFRGDTNGNYKLDMLDALAILSDVINGRVTITCDVTCDGKVNLLDVIRILKTIAQ